MQQNAWMTKWLFESWISHFIECLKKGFGVDLINRYLLILDGHNLHVTLEVVKISMESSLDIISLPSHTSHTLQPLDVACFALFKKAFRKLRDAWSMRNKHKPVEKRMLSEWTSRTLQLALIPTNIWTGFRTTSIWPFNCQTAIMSMEPLQGFAKMDVGPVGGVATGLGGRKT